MSGAAHSDSRFVVEECTNRDEWNSFVAQNEGPVYALRGWGDAVSSYGHDGWHLVVRDYSTEEIAAALPIYHVDSRLFNSQLLSPAFAERGSIVQGDPEKEEATRLLFEQTKQLAEELNVDSVSLRGSRLTAPDEFVTKNRYVTFQLSVDRAPEAVWTDMKDSRQRQIDQAATDLSLRFRLGESLADLKEYYRLYLKSMRGHGSPSHSFEFFRTLWNRLYEDGNLRLSMITREGSLINGMIDLSLGSTVYQWGVITDYEHRDLNGGSLLLWKSLEWAAENGYDTYEFGRTREGSGVYMFKKSFGGSKVWYDDIHYFPDGATDLPNPEDEKYERAKQIWRRLPIPITRIFGPKIRKRIGI